MGLWIFLAVIVALVVWAVSIFNRLVALRNRFKNAFSQIDVQLRRRYDLIPNLVESVKGYMQHERGTLEAVVKARGNAVSAAQAAAARPGEPAAMQGLSQAEGALGGALGRLLAVFEQYPDLKANQNVLGLQEELSSTENKVAFAHQAYNDSVMEYNTRRVSFPDSIFAGMFGFATAELLQATESVEERKAPQVRFEGTRLAAATFFEQQHLARRNTRVLFIRSVLATIAVVLAVDLVAGTAHVWTHLRDGVPLAQRYAAVPRAFYVWASLGTALLIFAVSAFNVTKLGGSGAAVAEMVGARRVEPATREPLERRLLNIVEEMAIAAGVRVPAVYVMDAERGINAFAAGWDTTNCVVAVTRGALETLSRDELQGVIGHEFSHIVNGGIRLNIRMIGVLAGIIFIGAIGQFLMRSVRRSEGKSAGQILVLGLALFIIGYVGLFFARLIKAAVSRQREFLADASSVQFTRNPDGICGALDQIRAAAAGAAIPGRYAEEISHMFFGQAIRVYFGGLFDPPPPLEERIRRVNPRFAPSAYRTKRSAAPLAAELPEETGAVGLVEPAGRRLADP